MSGIQARKQVPIPINYKGQQLDKEFVADFIIEDTLVVEIKAVEIILPVHEVQLVTYLKLAEKNIGLLINFNVPVLTAGIRRKVHDLQEN
jgi:GxxExxY protein